MQPPQGSVAYREIVYPDSDGKPIAETQEHIDELLGARFAIKNHLRRRADAWVAGNMFLYYEEGNPQACLAPDVFAVLGIENKPRRSYKLWEEAKAPCFVLELTSRSSRYEDQGTKKAVYADLGVAEYFIFDPLGEYLTPPLQGFRLHHGNYEPMRAGPGGVLESRKLGIRIVPEPGHLRLVNVRTGKTLPYPDDLLEWEVRARREGARARREGARAKREEARAKREAAMRQKAERRAQKLEAEIERLRARASGRGSSRRRG